VPRHGARLDAPLVVDYSASRRLVVDYFAYTARHVTRFVAPLVVDYSASRRSSSTTSPPPRVRVPRHVARLVTRLVAPFIVNYSSSRRLVVDYSASRRLVVNYFASAARPGVSAQRAARFAAHRRLLHLA
jgi:hypothetical protein